MNEPSRSSPAYCEPVPLPDLAVWDRMKQRRTPMSFSIELTARCNNNCRHCYINLPAGDRQARSRELSAAEVERIAREAVAMGSVWCLLTGGEPLLRPDFLEIYLTLKRMGLLVSVFTNACLVTAEHVELLRNYPPRELEVTVYGATEATYERVTRVPGSYRAFMRGLDRLLSGGVRNLQLKAMALRSNIHEFDEISRFCRERTANHYRFDPLLHLRFDLDPERNEGIRAERLSPAEVAAVERADEERFGLLRKSCEKLLLPSRARSEDNHLFRCGAGSNSFDISYDGRFRLCSSLWHPDTTFDLRQLALAEAWALVPQVRRMRSDRPAFRTNCQVCPIVNFCLWCPAHSYLETGELDLTVPWFCEVAHARTAGLVKEDS